ncbi:MAG: SGNH/GDSL hydrolase family protein [Pirellulales bacterium]|nr:SGNH/GDSL hydrolase family protein [Pirellulales bacterium]
MFEYAKLSNIISCVILSFVFNTVSCFAITVVSTGDSITGQYSEFMPSSLASFGNNYVYPNPIYGTGGSDTARGGMASWNYTGLLPFPNDIARDYSQNVVNANPDVILFMLGTNDSSVDTGTDYRFMRFKEIISPCFDKFDTTGSQLIISSILPTVSLTGMNERIMNWYNPWLKSQAALYNAVYLDTWSSIQKVPNWSTTLMGPDGLHLIWPTGSRWFAQQMAQAVAMCEQNSMTLIYDTISTNELNVSGNVNVLSNVTVNGITSNSLTIGSGSAGSQAVPEPSIFLMIVMGLTFSLFYLRWKAR